MSPIYVIRMLKVRERRELDSRTPTRDRLPKFKLDSVLASFSFRLTSLFSNSIVANFIVEL